MIPSWIVPVAVGQTFERYEIEAVLGRGGWSEVYRAEDTRLRRKVALKVLRPDKGNPEAEARLFREARAAAGLAHPNTVAIHDIGEAEGIFYIVMELVSGKPLLAYVGDARISLARRLAWLVDIARALAAAHKAGIVHRDVKPSNVMVSDDDTVKVLDFGLAKPNAPVSFRTAEGHVLGTPRYMSPEQGTGGLVDARSDQFSFGITAWELLAGHHPGGILSENPIPPPLHHKVKEIPVPVSQVIARTLANAPEARFPRMDDVVVALEDVIAGRPPRMPDLPPSTSEADTSTVSSPGLEGADTVRAEARGAERSEPSLLSGLGGGAPEREAEVVKLKASLGGQVAPTLRLGGSDPPGAAEAPKNAPPGATLLSRAAPTGISRPAPPMPEETRPSGRPTADEIVAPPARARNSDQPTPSMSVTSLPTAAEAKERRTLTFAIVGILVLGLCAFAGAYLASKEFAKPVEPPKNSASP